MGLLQQAAQMCCRSGEGGIRTHEAFAYRFSRAAPSTTRTPLQMWHCLSIAHTITGGKKYTVRPACSEATCLHIAPAGLATHWHLLFGKLANFAEFLMALAY